MFHQNVWSKKNDLSRKAQKHNRDMELILSNESNESFNKTKEYRDNVKGIAYNEDKYITTRISLVNAGTVDALFSIKQLYNIKSMALLNFASYKHPGGMFLQGSAAQEESLCHHSNLYNILSQTTSYYEANKKNLNNNLYTNAALYTPNVVFFKDDTTESTTCDVITCAAPNIRSYVNYIFKIDENEIRHVIENRIKFILDIAYDNKVNTLILGAWGCGVFGNQSKLVAETFCFAIGTMAYADLIKHVVFAVPKNGENDPNYNAFYDAVDDYNRRLLAR